jgi:hypothetical protein
MKRRWVVLAAIGGALAAGVPAMAGDLEFFTGETLYAACSAKPADADYASRHAHCGGYVLGVSDAQQAAQGAGGAGRVCLPASASSIQLTQSVGRYLETHPDKRKLAAQDLVLEALSADFPCK